VFATALSDRTPEVAATPDDLVVAIEERKQALNAIVLAHYYQEPAIQDIADCIGDSLGLARKAAETDADAIVFAGVHFMAETAKILNPDKQVLLPDFNAGCSLAESCPPDAFAAFKADRPDHAVVSYINCSAAIKAMSDIVCTSSNAVGIINQIPAEQPIIFAPDRNLGRYVMQQTGRELVLWQGSCIVHETFSEKKIVQLQLDYPKAELIAHPECEAPLLHRAHFIGSTAKLLRHCQQSPQREFIVATEPGLIHQMQQAAPDKRFIPAPATNHCACNECPHMRLNTLEKLYWAMVRREPAIELDEGTRQAALRPIQRMLAMSS